MSQAFTFRPPRLIAVIGLIVACGLIAADHVSNFKDWALRFVQLLVFCTLVVVVLWSVTVVMWHILSAPMPRRTRGLLIAFGVFAMAWPFLVVWLRGAGALSDRLGSAIVLFVVLSILGFAGWVLFYAIMYAIETPGRMKQERDYRRRLQKLCIACGYAMVGNESGICPECGTPLEHRS